MFKKYLNYNSFAATYYMKVMLTMFYAYLSATITTFYNLHKMIANLHFVIFANLFFFEI